MLGGNAMPLSSGPDTRALPSLLPLALAFVLLTGAVGLSARFVWIQQHQARAIQHTLTVANRLAVILSTMQDAETGERGYLLTGDDSYLDPYLRAEATLQPKLDDFGLVTMDNPKQQEALRTLKQVATQRLALLGAAIEQRRSHGVFTHTGTGQNLMNQTRDIIGSMQAEEERLLANRQAAADTASLVLQIGIVSAVLLIVLLAVLVTREVRIRIETLASARDALAAANATLVQNAVEREHLEEQLRQSQKMDAIGQLTGGLAHDFNNMLAVVIGSLALFKRRTARGEPNTMRYIDNASDGAQRAAALTQRLLAFARKQPLTPESIDANRFVAGLSDLLRRTLGEAIEIETVLAGGLWRTHADPSQLENALLNLCVNARDAMPDGGKLTIETANGHLDDAYAATHLEVTAGQYVMIAVSDSGTGMTREVMAKAFDPFFTTKDVGKGTGLGLSQVFGFVRQTGGHVTIYSEPGQGSTVKMYFPRFRDEGSADHARPGRIPGAAEPGTPDQVVLVVEDEDRVRALSVEALRDLGYTTLEAESAATALRHLERHPEITLLFTDVVMPGMNGRKLADEALRLRPDLKVLFTTGYTRNALVHTGTLDPGVHLLGKPFTVEQLAGKVRQVLGAV